MTDFSYQLYSSRKNPDLGETLKMLADLGYTRVEGYGALYSDDALVEALKANLADLGLTMPTAHFSLDMLAGQADKVTEIAEAVGVQTIFCPHIGPDLRPDSAMGWEDFGGKLAEIGKPYRDAGYGFGWHNHDFEFHPTPHGAIPMESILKGGPDLAWEADIAWIIKGGGDPMDWIERHGSRIAAVHVKDIAPEGECADEDGWADVGHGTVDWKAIFEALKGIGAAHYIMEHDNPSDPARFAERSLKAAKTLKGDA
ncbi:sugar phosphate isomerase/epimerase [Sulfitobacter sp. D35]|uniref:sugar phosphate isomerase/epimerase family protein n=1 Tax=Sulfitobacter sp. D35 TaxID=3083252 RepID=UPI00296F5E8E|nr:sugar phosphate isomerase/epimerase [Sulfitobacter sp. D35]MDW4496441.1 sugar phosphate isomerase/epimerase [Sulfitobacter sp. D35]